MPYVVRLHNFHQLSAPKPCFTFSHPNRGRFTRGSSDRAPRVCSSGPPVLELIQVCRVAQGFWPLVIHPPSFLTDPMIDNNRYCTLEFPVEVNTVLHGFAGYFETVLYRDITLSECLGQCMSALAWVTLVRPACLWGLFHKASSVPPWLVS